MTKVCLQCGREFEPQRTEQLCSDECRRRRHNARGRAYYAANRERAKSRARAYREANRKDKRGKQGLPGEKRRPSSRATEGAAALAAAESGPSRRACRPFRMTEKIQLSDMVFIMPSRAAGLLVRIEPKRSSGQSAERRDYATPTSASPCGTSFVADANLVADALPRKIEERRCRKELSTVGQCEAFGTH
jgi:hypothetical protein